MSLIWRVIKHGKLDPAYNMAVDEVLMQQVAAGKSLPVIRFYNWEPAAVSIGYNQKYTTEVDIERIKAAGFGFVRRPTGGRAVLHRDELTYAVIAPTTGTLGGSVNASYQEISKALLCGFKNLGIDLDFEKESLDSHSQRLASNPCFTSSSKFELNYHGRKICGSAQLRKGDVLLQHGSILHQHDQSMLAQLMPLSDDKIGRLSNILAAKTVCINQILKKQLVYEDLIKAFTQGFQDYWQADTFILDAQLSNKENLLADKLAVQKYQTEKWNELK